MNRIRYFTALVQARPYDLHAPQRQQIYLRALTTIPNLTVHYGQFKPRRKRRPLVTPSGGLGSTVEIMDTEEKGSDVNLATYLLIDGLKHDYEQALIISNDSDLALPIKLVRDELNLPVGIMNPNLDLHQGTPKELQVSATFMRQLRLSALQSSQFPQILTDAAGSFQKPQSW